VIALIFRGISPALGEVRVENKRQLFYWRESSLEFKLGELIGRFYIQRSAPRVIGIFHLTFTWMKRYRPNSVDQLDSRGEEAIVRSSPLQPPPASGDVGRWTGSLFGASTDDRRSEIGVLDLECGGQAGGRPRKSISELAVQGHEPMERPPTGCWTAPGRAVGLISNSDLVLAQFSGCEQCFPVFPIERMSFLPRPRK